MSERKREATKPIPIALTVLETAALCLQNVWIVVFFQRWPYVGGLCAMISNHWYKIKLIRQIVHLPGSCRAQATYKPLVKSRKRKANLMSAWPEMGCECCVACFMDGQRLD